jgi:predicted ATPase
MAEAVSAAKELNDTHALASALFFAAILGACERNPAEVERLASEVIELSTRKNFANWLPAGEVLYGWAQSASGNTAEGLSWIRNGIEAWQATGARLLMPFWLALKAEALHLANHTSEALEVIRAAESLVERSEERWCCVELRRLRGVFLAGMSADETQIETSFGEAVSMAKQQKAILLEKRAETTYAGYRRQKANGSGEGGFRLPLS